MSREINKIIFSNPVHIFSAGFGTGLSPVAPGTVGTLFAIPVYLILASFGTGVYASFAVLLFLAGCYTCKQTAQALGKHDHPVIVIDEIVGYLLTMLFVPVAWYWVLAGFLLFRVFDILKPWPVSLADRQITGGFGIMVDDLLAAVYSALCLHGLIWVISV